MWNGAGKQNRKGSANSDPAPPKTTKEEADAIAKAIEKVKDQ